MISVLQARKKIASQLRLTASESLPLTRALGRVLARDVHAAHDFPLFDVSAMDGFAVRAVDCRSARSVTLKLAGNLKAGDAPGRALGKRQACRIMTGAGIPRGADAVVPREWAEEIGAFIHVPPQAKVGKGDHIRVRAEETRKHSLAMPRGTRLDSRWTGYLRNLGTGSVLVRRQPRVSLVVTGSELLGPGEKPKPGKIFDSNLPMLAAALAEQGLNPAHSVRIVDSKSAIKDGLKRALKLSDVVILVGGVSVGDYDYSRPVLKELGARTIFWGISQKPGKPMYFGTRGRNLIFGLPGNPASVLVCFHEYVLPALRAMQGLEPGPAQAWARLENEAKADKSKTLFLKARHFEGRKGHWVKVLTGQQSHKLKSLAEANCLVVLEPGVNRKKGETVELHPL